MSRTSALALFCGLAVAVAFDAEVISDLVTSSADEGRALTIKAEKFWQPVRDAAKHAVQAKKEVSMFDGMDSAIASLSDEHHHVRSLLLEALTRLKHADGIVSGQATQASELATEELASNTGSDAAGFSFLTGGQNFISLAIRRFVGGGSYSDRLAQQIQKRQSAVLSGFLRGASTSSGDVLKDCRLASKLAFDVLKYDIYNKGVPKTPAAAKDVAHRMIDVEGAVRCNFLSMITGTVNSITRDTTEKHDAPAATVTRATMAGLDDSLAAERSGYEQHITDI
mmetsp:Transcript_33989/g.60120  ORF Transcript_33989/g.60120 Transcript_33989/m.60120 type:complete len:282 (+) Transcript_33989:80-925(+)